MALTPCNEIVAKVPPCNLAGRGVLITRPVAQAEGLCRLVEAAGGRPICFPTVAIEPIADRGPVRELLLRDWDLILFVSRNAVEQALPLLPNPACPRGLDWVRSARLPHGYWPRPVGART